MSPYFSSAEKCVKSLIKALIEARAFAYDDFPPAKLCTSGAFLRLSSMLPTCFTSCNGFTRASFRYCSILAPTFSVNHLARTEKK
jgi:hypothetical protein